MENELASGNDTPIPEVLRRWFVAHFLVDMVFAIPMMITPIAFLKMFGWQTVDPIVTRVAAAALFGIGIESYLGRNGQLDQYLGMLNLKIIWSLSAIIGIGISLIDGSQGRPIGGWLVGGIFLLFSGVWIYWRITLERMKNKFAMRD